MRSQRRRDTNSSVSGFLTVAANAIACVFRTAVDFASTRLVFALAAGVLLGQAVDAKLLALELTLGAACLALWRCAYTLTSADPR